MCAPGWSGPNCASDINECFDIQCVNGGTCINTPGSYTCICDVGWTGSLCDIGEFWLDALSCAHNSEVLYPLKDKNLHLSYICYFINAFNVVKSGISKELIIIIQCLYNPDAFENTFWMKRKGNIPVIEMLLCKW